MMRTLAIARRDFLAYFLTPSGYIVTALFLAISGLFFFIGFEPGAVASMRPVFHVGAFILAIIAPAVTMRLVSEELRTGTIETLMTSPLAEWQIIAGKYIAGAAFLAVLLVPTGIYVLLLEIYGRPDYGEVFCGYLGMFVAGLAFLASGLFVSTLTSSQAVAFLLPFCFWLGLLLATMFLPSALGADRAILVTALSPALRLRDFSIGLIDTANVVYFLGIAVVFLGAAVKTLEARRWA